MLHVDPYWQKPGCWADLDWDAGTFPDPRAMTAELAELGFRLCLWINPYISVESPQFAAAGEAGYFLRGPDGATWSGQAWGENEGLPPMAIVDFTHPGAVRWWQDRLTRLLRDGVAVFKTDFGEAVPPGAVAANGMSGRDLHNVYTLLYNDAAADVTEAVHGYRLVWGRSSFLGGQRHAGQWGGDADATSAAWPARCAAGCPTGSAGCRSGATTSAVSTAPPRPISTCGGPSSGHCPRCTAPRHHQPAAVGLPARRCTAATREIVAARYRLLPYLCSGAVEAVRRGRTLLRPMIAACPADRATRDADAQYLLGTDLLVAPVTADDGQHDVYLPAGDWIDYATRAVYPGGGWRRFTRPPEQAPLFVRYGALLPVDPGKGATAEADPGTLTLGNLGRRRRPGHRTRAAPA